MQKQPTRQPLAGAEPYEYFMGNGRSTRVLHYILERAKGSSGASLAVLVCLLNSVKSALSIRCFISIIFHAGSACYGCVLTANIRNFSVGWYMKPWEAGHNGLSNSENPNSPQDAYPRVELA